MHGAVVLSDTWNAQALQSWVGSVDAFIIQQLGKKNMKVIPLCGYHYSCGVDFPILI